MEFHLARKSFVQFSLVFFLVPFLVNSQTVSKVQKRNDSFLQMMQIKQRDFITPSHIRTALLYSKLGFYVAFNKQGAIQGTTNEFCQQNRLRCLFELESFGTSLIRVKNAKTRQYFAISQKGKVYTTKQRTQETLLHSRLLSTGFTVFWSYSHHRNRGRSANLYLAMKRNGDLKNASKTTATHKSSQFFVMYS